MAIIGSIESALANRAPVMPTVTRGDLIREVGPVGERNPNCKIIGQSPNSVVEAHFHIVDQFQVMIDGGGTLGKRAIEPILVHFAAAHTPYGPIVSDERGIQYLVFRNAIDCGAAYMPASASKLARVPRRHRVSEHIPPIAREELSRLTDVVDRPLIAPEPDGLSVWLRALPAGCETSVPDLAQSGGCFVLVTTGALLFDGETVSTRSCIYFAADDEPSPLTAGPEGAELLFMRFPTYRDLIADSGQQVLS